MSAAGNTRAATSAIGEESAGFVSLRNAVMLLVVLAAIWQALFLWVGETALASPVATLRYASRLVTSEAFYPHLRDTMAAFVAGYALAVVLGLAVGCWLGFHRLSGEVMEPMVVAVYSLPKVTLYPILLLAFGLGISAKIAFGTLHGVVPIILFTLSAVRNVRPVLVKTGRVLRLTPLRMATSILFPAALPEIFTGLRVGFSLTLIGTLLAEMFASQRGLGFLLMNGIGLHNVELIMAITVLVVAFAAAMSTLLLAIDHRLHRRL
jgi:NitT/TauT family transport system permease protein